RRRRHVVAAAVPDRHVERDELRPGRWHARSDLVQRLHVRRRELDDAGQGKGRRRREGVSRAGEAARRTVVLAAAESVPPAHAVTAAGLLARRDGGTAVPAAIAARTCAATVSEQHDREVGGDEADGHGAPYAVFPPG